MGKKLLSILFTVFLFFLSPWSGFGQTCPTSVSISADTGNNICAGTNVTFTANPSGGSGTFTYQWKIDGVNAGTNSNIFTISSLDNGDKITVTVIKSGDTTCTISSSSYTMTVNANKTPTVSVSANKNSICPGESVTYTATNTNGGTSPQYSFYLNNGTSAIQAGAANTFTTTTLNNGDKIRVVLTSNVECATSDTAEILSNSITVRAGTPVVPGTIGTSVGSEICPGTSQTYSISAVTGATSYQWTLPSGWSGSSTSTSINVIAGTSNGTISVKAINDCGTSDSQSLPITIKAGTPAVPGTINGTSAVCPGVSETYSVTGISGATEYIWSLPNGWTGTSTTNSITVNTGSTGGNISVQAKNDCGTSTAKTLAVSVKPGTPSVPAAINGTASVCPGTQQTYSITGVTGATSYIWTLPNGWTGTSTTTSITATSGTAGGNITVKATNDCGTSTEQTIAVTVKPGTPATPEAVSGSTTVCPGTSEIYSVTNNPDAEYIWTLPNGWTGTSTTSSITVNTGSSGSGNISVKAKNDCGTSTAATIAVSVKAPAPVMSGTISGPATVCLGSTGLVYTIPAITNATSYVWTLPNGSTQTSTSNSISTTIGTSGNISVIAKNDCGDSSASQNFSVQATSGVPATPSAITSSLTSTAICPVVDNVTFSVDPISNATGYNWILPTGWEITSGANTNLIKVKINASQSYASPTTVKVEATNICGKSGVRTSQDIFLDNYIIANIGPDLTVCKIVNSIPQLTLSGTMNFGNSNLSPTFTTTGSGTFQNIPSNSKGNFTVNYTPSAADYQAGQVKITMTIPKITSGNNTSCGTGVDEMIINFKNLPTATITATAPVCSGNTPVLTFTGTPNSRVTYKLPNGTNQTVDIGSSGTATVTTAALTATSTFSLVSAVNLDTPACSNTFPASASTTVTVTPKPTAAITYAGPFCTSVTTSQNPSLTGTGAFTGGTYSSTTGLTINSAGSITPSTSTAGTYTVTYSTPAGGGCEPVTTTTQVTITKAPTLAISYAGTPFCTSDSAAKAVTLTGTDGFTGGTFSAPTGLTINADTGAITASSSTAGTYTVTYKTPVAGGCGEVIATTQVTITNSPKVTISYADAPFCHSDTSAQAVTLTGTDAFSGGTFTAPSGVSIDPSTGAITPKLSSTGTYEIIYTIPASAGCGEVSATFSITITETPTAEISYAGPYCSSDATAHIPAFTNTAGVFEEGVYRSTPEGLSIDPTTGAINAKNSSPNTYTVFYQLPAGAGCGASEIQTTVRITQVPQLEINYSKPFCTSESTPQPVTFSTNAVGAYQGGSFTGTAGLEIDAVGNIVPAASTPGIHTVTYTTLDANGCGPVTVTTEIEIFGQPVITTPPVNVGICSTQPASFEVVASGDNLVYQWKRVDGAAITNATGVNTAKLSFNNATATNAGEYFVEINGSSPCSAISSEPVTLNVDENIVIIKPTEDLTFCDEERADVTFEFIAHANGAPLEFTWIKDGADLPNINSDRLTYEVTGPSDAEGRYSGTLKISNPNPADNGVYAVRISGPDYFTCSEATSKTFTLSVTPLPEPPSTEPVVLCQGETASPLTAIGATGATFKWYNSTMEPIVGVPTPSTLEAGNTVYYVTQTTEVCESNPTELIVTVNPTPALPSTQEIVNYCFEEGDISALSATGTDTNATINWYGPNDSTIGLETAPVPVTSSTGITKYWVSQSIGECESELVLINVTIDPLPELAVSADSNLICAGSSTVLHATGADSYSWISNGEVIGNTADLTVTPSVTSTYILTGFNNTTGCQNITEITIEVDEPTVVGTLDAPTSVCINNPNGTLTLTGYTGEVIRWETKPANSTTWTAVNGNTASTLNFSALTVSTDYRVIVKNGVCAEETAETRVNLDPLPIGGKLTFPEIVTAENTGRIFMICQGATSGYKALSLSGHTGNILAWKYSIYGAPWIIIAGESGNFTGSTLTAAQIQALNLPQTTVFRVEIGSGSCTPNAFSQTAILSVIPTDIEPTPVTVSDDVVCLGDQVTLSSETGYSSGTPKIVGGSFDNAGLKNAGWRFRFNGNDANFETNANNVVPDFWSRATPRSFPTANMTTSPYSTSEQVWDPAVEDGNKGFALVSGRHTATMETPVFGIGSMDQAILTFDQAYNLTPGATITVEISTNGGATYENVLFSRTGNGIIENSSSGNYSNFGTGTPITRPKNKMVIDLGNYLGQNNLRIRFKYVGARTGDLWAVDAITVPEGPRGITIEWNDYTNPTAPILIGTTNSVQYIPKKIGLNIFEVKTKLIFDSAGNTCEVAENAENIEVFVFDKYTTSVTAEYGSCGVLEAQLTGKILNSTGIEISTVSEGEIVPTPDGYIGEWAIIGTGVELIDPNPADNVPAKNDPLAKLITTSTGTYNVSWTLVPNARNEAGELYANPEACPPVVTPLDIVIEGCIALDFDGVDDYVDLGMTYTGNYSIEAWIRPEAPGGTIISGPNFIVTAPTSLTLGQWSHIAVTGGQLYINGVVSGNATTGTGGERALIGGKWVNGVATEFFEGWIEEVRIWNTAITLDQIQFMMNQRLIPNGAQMGEQIPMDVPGGLTYTNLAGYYRLISAEPDPANLVTFDAALKPINGVTIDLANNSIPGVLNNMTTNQQNTAPLPYFSGGNGSWDTAETWARPTVWKIPNTGSINWNIVKTSHNITANREIIVLGLLSEINTLEMLGTNPTGWVGGGTGNPLRISHYLNLDGVIDLQGESQLIQPMGSIVDGGSTGSLQRDQQGTANSYNYNYWSSPVSPTANGETYTVAGILRDGSIPASPVTITFGDPYAFADAGKTNPIKISNYWVSIFNGAADQYGEWAFQYGSAAPINVGEGYTMKGTSGDIELSTAQNYTFEGLPNNGTIELTSNVDKNYLIGNPYPSAIDSWEFIDDNLAINRNGANYFDGALYFWDHFGKKDSHILLEYVGGYASLTKIGGVPAISNDNRIDSTGAKNNKLPGRYIPVGQAFFINSTTGAGYTISSGDIKFENDQRIFIKEGNDSQFLKPEEHVKSPKVSEIEKIRISYKSPLGYLRQILVGAHPSATNGFDLGYDAPLFDYNKEDMYWIQESNWLVIQGVSNFEKDQVLPLGILLEEEGEFTIKIDSLENMEDNKMVYIRDILNDTIHNLTKEPFIATSEKGYINDRFEIIFYKEEPPITPQEPVDPTEPIPGKTPPGIELDVLHGHSVREFQILNPQQVDITNLYVYDLNGKLLQTYYNIINDKVVLLPVRNFSSGVYIVKLHAEDQVISKKIIISN